MARKPEPKTKPMPAAGGSYVRDKKTGELTPIDPTADAPAVSPTEPEKEA